jgi:hypothetical protein
MGEAEISEFFVKQLDLADENGVLNQINYIPINNGLFEHYSFFYAVRRASRYEFQNLMPTSRDLASFSQTSAAGLFILGSYVCVTLFDRDYTSATRKNLFGVEDFSYDPPVSNTDRDRILDVLIDRLAMSSSVDLEPVRGDVKKIMQDEFDEAVKSGVNPRDALEESCAALVSSIAPYLL